MQYRVVSQGYLGPDIYGDVYSPMKAENTQLQVKRMDRRQRDLLKLLLWKDNVTKIRRLKPVHTGDYSRRFRRQFVAENSDWRRKVRLSPNSATVAEFGVVSPFSATVALFCDSVDKALQKHTRTAARADDKE